MRFLSFSAAFSLLAAGALMGGCQSPDKFYRDASAPQFTGGGGHAGSMGAGGSFTTGTGGSSSTGRGGNSGGGGSTFTGAGGSAAGGSGGSTGTGTGGGGGTVPPPMPCTTCDISVKYTCSGSDNNAIAFTLRLINNVGTAVPYSNITIRYWFTKNATNPKLECYYTSLPGMCASVLGTFHPMATPVANADTYLEVGFAAAAGSLDGFHSNTQDQIQLAVHDASYASPTIQTDDYSFDCSMLKTEIESPLITAYVGGMLKFGTEPGGSASAVDAGSGD